MEWKSYYRAELEHPDVRATLTQMLHATGSGWLGTRKDIGMQLPDRAIVSFPHTAVAYSGSLQAQVVAELYQSGIQRVIAMGVLHSHGIEAFQHALDEMAPGLEREAAYEQVSGGWLPDATEFMSPFGKLELAQPKPGDILRIDTNGLLAHEFSLDTFLSIVRLGEEIYACEPLEVFPIYVGMTRHPRGKGFETASLLARRVAELWDENTAVVATGDVVHYGTPYGPERVKSNNLEKHFRSQLEGSFARALEDGNWPLAYRLAQTILQSDQRELLPVLGNLLGGGIKQEILAFSLSDYAPIFECAPPCVVASALIAYLERGKGSVA